MGHATVLLQLGGVRLLTDPVLRSRLGHLRRHGAPPAPEVSRDLDAILISHLHLDHLDAPSLRRLDRSVPVVVPRGAGELVSGLGFADVVELSPGDSVALPRMPRRSGETGGGDRGAEGAQSARETGGADRSDAGAEPARSAGDTSDGAGGEGARSGGRRQAAVEVVAVAALHDGRRRPFGGIEAETLGFELRWGAGRRAYFAGDTDLFPELAALAGDLDLALLPVWGWGPTLGEGHMDPARAAAAAALLRPRLAVPIHWGSFYPRGLARVRPRPLTEPPRAFAAQVAELAPDVAVRVLEPGESLELSS